MDEDEIRELMLEYESDHAPAERAGELMSAGWDEDEAIEMARDR